MLGERCEGREGSDREGSQLAALNKRRPRLGDHDISFGVWLYKASRAEPVSVTGELGKRNRRGRDSQESLGSAQLGRTGLISTWLGTWGLWEAGRKVTRYQP